jgi:hypothetical protein
MIGFNDPLSGPSALNRKYASREPFPPMSEGHDQAMKKPFGSVRALVAEMLRQSLRRGDTEAERLEVVESVESLLGEELPFYFSVGFSSEYPPVVDPSTFELARAFSELADKLREENGGKVKLDGRGSYSHLFNKAFDENPNKKS